VSLSTLQSKAAKRRDDAQKGARVAKKANSTQNAVSAVNGFTGMTDKTAQHNQFDDQMELDLIQVDTLQPRRKRVSPLYESHAVLSIYFLWR